MPKHVSAERQKRYRARHRVEEAKRHFHALGEMYRHSSVLRSVLLAARIHEDVIKAEVEQLETAERSVEARQHHLRSRRGST